MMQTLPEPRSASSSIKPGLQPARRQNLADWRFRSASAKRRADGLGRAGLADKSGQHKDGHDIRQDLDELHRDWFLAPQDNALEPDFHGFGEAKKQAGKRRWQWFPFSENQCRQRNETAPGSHIARK